MEGRRRLGRKKTSDFLFWKPSPRSGFSRSQERYKSQGKSLLRTPSLNTDIAMFKLKIFVIALFAAVAQAAAESDGQFSRHLSFYCNTD